MDHKKNIFRKSIETCANDGSKKNEVNRERRGKIRERVDRQMANGKTMER